MDIASSESNKRAVDGLGRYLYTPLRSNEIRLLEIVPAGSEDPIELCLHHVSLDDLPPYGAVSYTWGDDVADRVVLIDGKVQIIKPNLEAALLEFRRMPPFRKVGLDALQDALVRCNNCLKQSNNNGTLFQDGGSEELSSKVQSLSRHTLECERLLRQKSRVLAGADVGLFKKAEENLTEWADKQAITMHDHCDRVVASAGFDVPARNNAYLLWIDAICMNQQDLDERKAQVLLMGQIYQRSQRLIIWLGKSTSTSYLAVDSLDRFREAEKSHEDHAWQRFDQWVAGSSFSPTSEQDWWMLYNRFKQIDNSLSLSFTKWLHNINCPEDEIMARCGAVMNLLLNPWFTRCWIIQEHALGGQSQKGQGNIVVCCGSLQVSSFIGILSHVDLHQFPQYQEYSLTRMKVVLNSLGTVRRRFESKHKPFSITRIEYLLGCVASFMVASVKDPRDKIYSLLGLVNEQYSATPLSNNDWGALIVDYTVSVEHVWSSFVQEVVQSTKRLDVLGLCDGQRNDNCRRTWTLNCCPTENQSDFFVSILAGDIQFADPYLPLTQGLTFNVTPGTEAVFRFKSDLSVLTVSGMIWTEIAEIYNIKLADANRLRDTIITMTEWARKSAVLASNVSWTKRLLNSLIVVPKGGSDIRTDFSAATEQLANGFDDWLSSDVDEAWERTERNARASERWPLRGNSPTRFSATLAQGYTGGLLCVSEDGYVGRAISPFVEAGDLVCVILGCAMPMVLHPVGNYFEVRGEIYVPDIMNGEAMAALHEGEKKLREFELH